MMLKNLNKATSYLILNIKKTFTKLRQALIQAPILQSFDSEHHIHIQIDSSGYIISRV